MLRRSSMRSQSVVARCSTSTWPEVGNSRPFTILSAVVFPEPLRPSSTSVRPARRGSQIVQDEIAADAIGDVRNSRRRGAFNATVQRFSANGQSRSIH